MRRIAIVARLRPGAHERATELISRGPPFDLASWGFDRHTVFVAEAEVVFVFEGDEVEWRVDDLVGNFFSAGLQRTFSQWRELVDGDPQLAEEAYFWEASAA
jgi:hypothetical protein